MRMPVTSLRVRTDMSDAVHILAAVLEIVAVAVSQDLIRSDNKVPELEDFDGAAMGLVRLQSVYKLRTDDIAQGNVRNIEPSCSLVIETSIPNIVIHVRL